MQQHHAGRIAAHVLGSRVARPTSPFYARVLAAACVVGLAALIAGCGGNGGGNDPIDDDDDDDHDTTVVDTDVVNGLSAAQLVTLCASITPTATALTGIHATSCYQLAFDGESCDQTALDQCMAEPFSEFLACAATPESVAACAATVADVRACHGAIFAAFADLATLDCQTDITGINVAPSAICPALYDECPGLF